MLKDKTMVIAAEKALLLQESKSKVVRLAIERVGTILVNRGNKRDVENNPGMNKREQTYKMRKGKV